MKRSIRMKHLTALLALTSAFFLGSCEKQSFDETKQLRPSHAHGHSDDKAAHGSAPAADHGAAPKPAH
jgi:hypothetical protein